MTMMIQAIRLTRKKAALAVILAGAVLAALILLSACGVILLFYPLNVPSCNNRIWTLRRYCRVL